VRESFLFSINHTGARSDQVKYAAQWAEYAGTGKTGFGEKSCRPTLSKLSTSMEVYSSPPWFSEANSDPGIQAVIAVVEECLMDSAQMFDGCDVVLGGHCVPHEMKQMLPQRQRHASSPL
jgi:hypothetical protein